MRLHPRHAKTTRARLDISDAVIEASEEHNLTSGEIVSILAALTSDYTKYILRSERHPNEPDKKADEA